MHTDASAFIAVRHDGFVDGACFTASMCAKSWVADMEKAGMTIQCVSRAEAKRLLLTFLPTKAAYGRMIVARRADGEVEAAGWDCAETRNDAKEWLRRGLVIEFVTKAQVEAIKDPLHVFSTTAPIGEVLTHQQARAAFEGY